MKKQVFTMIFIYLLILCAVNTEGAKEGEVCTHNDLQGVCTEITKCLKIIEDPVYRKFAPACQTRGLVEVVCCNTTTITEIAPCKPLPSSITSSRTGQKAWDKCIDYQQLVHPCRDGVRQRFCPHESDADFGSTHAKRNEFPHAVLLGYTNERKELDWLCGGTLVSERFILTAAHCVSSRVSGPVTHVAVHPTDRSSVDPGAIFRVQAVIKHPEYRSPRTYHDVALLELEQPVPLSSTTVPACLLLDGASSGERSEDPSIVIATSWNTNDILGTGITWLRKFKLARYSIDECSRLYPENRRGGYNDTTQVCYGHRDEGKDICQDDGGSALVVENSKLSCMYSAVGVASYGRGCFAHGPGVYSRVEPYLPWIEAVVWP